MSGTTATTAESKPLTLSDIHEAIRLVEQMPPPEWMLVSPGGKVWRTEDPNKLLQVLAAEVLLGMPIEIPRMAP